MCSRIRSDNEQKTTAESLTGLQGEGGFGGDQGRSDACAIGGTVRRSPEPDHGLESAARRQRSDFQYASTATPHGGLTPAEVPLIEAETLSEQPGPPQFYDG